MLSWHSIQDSKLQWVEIKYGYIYLESGRLLLLPSGPELMQQRTCLQHEPLSLSATHMSSSAQPGFLSSRHQTPIKDRARAKAVTSAAWNKAARPTAPACQLPDESWRVLWNYDKNSASRPPTNPCPLCILHWQERWASLEKRVVSMLALVGGLKDLWTVGRLWCGNKSVRMKLFVPSSDGCLDKRLCLRLVDVVLKGYTANTLNVTLVTHHVICCVPGPGHNKSRAF